VIASIDQLNAVMMLQAVQRGGDEQINAADCWPADLNSLMWLAWMCAAGLRMFLWYKYFVYL
jgi:hypothetical protein